MEKKKLDLLSGYNQYLISMWYHSQNLNNRPDGSYGPKLIHGRAWLHYGEDGGRNRLGWCWNLKSKSCAIGVTLSPSGHDDTISLHLAFLPISFWIYLTCSKLAKSKGWAYLLNSKKDLYKQKEFSFSIHHWSLWGNFYGDPMCWSSSDPWWMRWNFDIIDFLLGKAKYSENDMETIHTIISMPEKRYDATVRIFCSVYGRPRWFAKRLVRSTISVEGGIPHPGKGTMSYNCGEDRIYSVTSTASTSYDAVAEMVRSVGYCREKYPL